MNVCPLDLGDDRDGLGSMVNVEFSNDVFHDDDIELGMDDSLDHDIDVLDVSDSDVNTRPRANIDSIDSDHILMTIEIDCSFSL